MKATKEIFDRAVKIYESLEQGNTQLINEYNNLLDEYDFANEPFTGPDDKEGLDWCYGQEMIPAVYDSLEWYTEMSVPADEVYAIGHRNGKSYLINHLGQEVLEADEMRPHLLNILPVSFRQGQKWGMAGNSGKVLIAAEYDEIAPNTDGYTFLHKGDRYGFDFCGHMVEPQFDAIDVDAEDRICVTLNGIEGYLDANDAFTTDPEECYYHINYDI